MLTPAKWWPAKTRHEEIVLSPSTALSRNILNPVKNEEKMVIKIVIFSRTMGDSWTSEQWRWSTFCPNIVFPSIFGLALASTHFCSLIWTKYYSIFFLSPKPTSLRTACGFFRPFQKKISDVSPTKNGWFFGDEPKKNIQATRLGEVFQGVEFHVLVAVPRFVSQAKPMVTSESGVFFFHGNNTKTAHEVKSCGTKVTEVNLKLEANFVVLHWVIWRSEETSLHPNPENSRPLGLDNVCGASSSASLRAKSERNLQTKIFIESMFHLKQPKIMRNP